MVWWHIRDYLTTYHYGVTGLAQGQDIQTEQQYGEHDSWDCGDSYRKEAILGFDCLYYLFNVHTVTDRLGTGSPILVILKNE